LLGKASTAVNRRWLTLTDEKANHCELAAAELASRDGIGDCRAILDFILTDLLAETAASLVSASASQAKLFERLDGLRQRLATDRFQLAVLGQFKRGKSTLLNALLGADALPTGVVPVTAIPTFLQSAPRPRLRVTFAAGRVEESEADRPPMLRERLSAFVTEGGNPRNLLGVARVEVFLPSELLARGVVLIDTPGVGSTFRHNTVTATDLLAECDAALFVVSPDPPITEVEVQFLARVRQTVARVIVVLNKIDTLEPDERATVAAFLRDVLAEQAGLDTATPIFCLSSRNGLRARLAGDTDALEASGLAQLETHLTQFLAQEKQVTLCVAVARKASALVADLQMETGIRLKALRLPLADLEQRMAAFDEAVTGFEAERRAAADALAGDRLRAFEELEADAERLRIQGRAALVSELDRALASGARAEQVRAALDGIIVRFFDKALAETIAEVGRRLVLRFRAHQFRADQLIAVVRRTAADLLEIPFHAPESTEALELRHDPFWVTRARPEVLGAIAPGLLDQFLTQATRQVRLRRRLVEEIEAVLLRNVENLRWAMRQNLEDAFRRFRADLDERLTLSLLATRGAMAAAHDRRRQQSASVEAEMESTLVTLSKLNSMQTALAPIS
jgi:GTP-binding protein EngB required for normal cell division